MYAAFGNIAFILQTDIGTLINVDKMLAASTNPMEQLVQQNLFVSP